MNIPSGALVQCIKPLRVIVMDRAYESKQFYDVEKGWTGVVLRVREFAFPGLGRTESALTKYDILWSTSAGGNLIGKNISHRFFTVML
jgi:hypothetical protein